MSTAYMALYLELAGALEAFALVLTELDGVPPQQRARLTTLWARLHTLVEQLPAALAQAREEGPRPEIP